MNRDVTQSAVNRRTLVRGAAALGTAALLAPALADRAHASKPATSPAQAAALTTR